MMSCRWGYWQKTWRSESHAFEIWGFALQAALTSASGWRRGPDACLQSLVPLVVGNRNFGQVYYSVRNTRTEVQPIRLQLLRLQDRVSIPCLLYLRNVVEIGGELRKPRTCLEISVSVSRLTSHVLVAGRLGWGAFRHHPMEPAPNPVPCLFVETV